MQSNCPFLFELFRDGFGGGNEGIERLKRIFPFSLSMWWKHRKEHGEQMALK